MRLRHVATVSILSLALLPRTASAQDAGFIKSKLTDLIRRSGVYVGANTRSAIDDDVIMTDTWGVSFGFASQKPGWKVPFSFAGYRANLETTDRTQFADLRARQIMSGVGYQWVKGKLVYGAQLGLGFSFNHMSLHSNAIDAFTALGGGPVTYDIDNSFVVRPQIKVEYFATRKLSFRTQVAYNFTDPDVVIQTATQTFTHAWQPQHWQVNFGVGFFPFRK